jgi:hypothetical protein
MLLFNEYIFLQVRFVTVFRTALLKRRRLTRVLSTLFKALARDGSAPLGATAVTLAAWRNYCATASAPRVMGRLLCAATALPPFTQGRHIEAGAVGIDDDGTAFAVEGYPTLNAHATSGTGPYNAYRFTNSSNDAWEEPSKLFSFV